MAVQGACSLGHVRQMCKDNGWEFDAVKLGVVPEGTGALDGH